MITISVFNQDTLAKRYFEYDCIEDCIGDLREVCQQRGIDLANLDSSPQTPEQVLYALGLRFQLSIRPYRFDTSNFVIVS